MSHTTMRAVGVVPGKREVRLLDHPAPRIATDNQVRVRALEVGICGTDKEICTFVYGSPPSGFDYLVLGHESLGQVVEVGSGVKDLRVGDLVVPSVRRPCEHAHCQPCRAGLQDFCSTGDFTERGIKMTHGFMTEYYVDEDRFLNLVPAELRDVAVLVEPLTVAEKAMSQVWKVQQRLPWLKSKGPLRGEGLNAVVLGAGPVGILGAMTLVKEGFNTFVYSRSKTPNPKSDLINSIGAKYVSSEEEPVEEFAKRVGTIDLVYEALGVSGISFQVLRHLGLNGIFVFTGIPAPKSAIHVEADLIMRNVVLMNQAVIGTVNADRAAFQNAIADLGVFKRRWPQALRSMMKKGHTLENFKELLHHEKSGGIKNVIEIA